MNNSHLTAIYRKEASIPLKFLAKKSYLNTYQNIIDFGCGHKADVNWLNNNKYDAKGFDIYWHNREKVLIKGAYDIVLCTYVLNVVGEQMRNIIIKQLKWLTKPNGKIYITVRRDIKKDYTTKKGTKQYLVYLPYKIVRENTQYCIYEA